ncbi:hypothetical protein YC2023_080664 [Brassica napus]
MKPQVVTIHKIFSDANMPPNFYEIDEKEGSNDDSDGEDHRRFNMESRGFCITDDFKIGYIKSPSYLNSNEKILIGVATKGGMVSSILNPVNKASHAQKFLNASRLNEA